MTINLKLVGAQTYFCEAFRGGFVLKGGIVEVEDKIAKKLLKETFMDALNNVHPIFVQTQEEPVVEPGDDDDEDGEEAVDESEDVLGESEEAPRVVKPAAPVKKPRTRAPSAN